MPAHRQHDSEEYQEFLNFCAFKDRRDYRDRDYHRRDRDRRDQDNN